MFRRWPSSSTAAALHQDAGQAFQEHADEVSFLLSSRPRDAVLFVLLTLEDAQTAWRTAFDRQERGAGIGVRAVLRRGVSAPRRMVTP